jgi:SAM-dependent methyltransferase
MNGVRLLLETATWENLDEAAYLEANRDVRAAGITARQHFDEYGRREGRPQLTRGFDVYRLEKFKRFRDILDLEAGCLAKGTFPIVVGENHFSIVDYVFESANPGFGPFDHELLTNPNGLYMDLGCGLRETVHTNCLYVEVYPSLAADLVIEPTCRYPIRSSSLDGIGCFAVLEHTRQPWLVVQEIHRMLKPGGKAYIDWPFLQPVHGFPSHFFNATRSGLCSLFQDNGFDVDFCETGLHQTPAYTVRWILHEMLARLPDGDVKDELSRMTVVDLSKLDPQSDQWRRIIGALPDAAVSEFACGNWLKATKQGAL